MAAPKEGYRPRTTQPGRVGQGNRGADLEYGTPKFTLDNTGLTTGTTIRSTEEITLRLRQMYRVVVSAVLVVALAAGCASSAKTTTPTTTRRTTSAAASSPSTTSQVLAQNASDSLWQPSDFPAAFKAQPDGSGACPSSAASCSSLNLEPVWHDLTTCLHITDAPQGVATSPTYLEGQSTQARVTVEYTAIPTAQAIAAALVSSNAKDCIASAFTADAKRSAPSGATPGPVTVAPLTGYTLPGQTVATRINVTMTLGTGSSARTIQIFQDFVVVVNGHAVLRCVFLSPGGAFPADLEYTLVRAVVVRAGG